jgi:sugar O-acyltransferase (sialic acid O-acetyltransferase NeuD family)
MKKAVIGNGGHAREVQAQMGIKMSCFVDDKYLTEDTLPISSFDPLEYEIMVAVGDSNQRSEIVKKLPKETKYFSFIHPTSLLMNEVTVGEGSFIGAYSIITTNVILGKHVILNRGVQIGHDCLIGDYFSAMPNTIVSGNVTIDEKVYVGTNSSIKEKIKITNDVIIGLNSGVIHNINKSGTYVGTPSLKIK